MRIGITGHDSFLSTHMNWFLFPHSENIEIINIGRNILQENSNELANTIENCEVILHLDGSHPGNTLNEEEIHETNILLVNNLINALEEKKVSPYVIHGSTTHIEKDTPYGKSKKEVGERLKEWGSNNEANVTNLIIPNEFGESCEPFGISVVSTFIHQLLNEEVSEINPTAQVSLIHAQAVAKQIFELIENPLNEDVVLGGEDILVSELYSLLKDFKEKYYSGVIPKLHSSLHRDLFNTMRSHVVGTSFYPRELKLHTDERGSLFEMIREETGGQTFMSTTKSGITRGNHYHTRKIERFCVLQGQATISIRKILSNDIINYEVTGDRPVYIDMPTFYTHNITNTGTENLITTFWCNEIFNPEDADTFFNEVN